MKADEIQGKNDSGRNDSTGSSSSLWHAMLCASCGFEGSRPTETVPERCPTCDTERVTHGGEFAIWPPLPMKEPYTDTEKAILSAAFAEDSQ